MSVMRSKQAFVNLKPAFQLRAGAVRNPYLGKRKKCFKLLIFHDIKPNLRDLIHIH